VSLSAQEAALVTAIACARLNLPAPLPLNEQVDVLRSALRDIKLGAQAMQESGSPSSAFNRYAAEVERVASAALTQVR
jgi:hypothetical protein